MPSINQSEFYEFPDPLTGFFDDSECGSPLSELSDSSAYSPPHDNPIERRTQDPEDELEDERQRRLAHKRDLAREGRKRKKTKEKELQAKVEELQAELERERKRSHAAELSSNLPTSTSFSPPVKVSTSFTNANFPNPDAALCAFVDNVMTKVQEDHAQLNQLQASMTPCLVLRFVQWVLSRNDKFYTDSGSLWFSLFVQEVGASTTQLSQLLALRKEYLELPTTTLAAGADRVTQAFEALRYSLDESTRMLGSFMQIFNPAQLVVLLQWVESFGAVCIKITV